MNVASLVERLEWLADQKCTCGASFVDSGTECKTCKAKSVLQGLGEELTDVLTLLGDTEHESN